MPRPSLRSRTLRRIKKKLPGGASVIHYLKRNPSPARCAVCGRPLHGVAGGRAVSIKKLAKSKKVPSRMFGGNLCPSCARERLKERARKSPEVNA
jgi:large subunit ribosomal protein L34e